MKKIFRKSNRFLQAKLTVDTSLWGIGLAYDREEKLLVIILLCATLEFEGIY